MKLEDLMKEWAECNTLDDPPGPREIKNAEQEDEE